MLQCVNKSQVAVLLFWVMTAVKGSAIDEVKESMKWDICIVNIIDVLNTFYDFPPLNDTQHDLFHLQSSNFDDVICNLTQEEVQNKTSNLEYSVGQCMKSVIEQYYTLFNIDYDSLELTHLKSLIKEKEEFILELHSFIKYLNNSTCGDLNKNNSLILQNYINKLTLEIEYLKDDERTQTLLRHYIQPVLHGIIFFTGLLSNGVLLVIFARHREIWTSTNVLLLNLAIGDIFSLVVNLPLFYIYSTSITWKLGEGMCKLLRFIRHVGIGVNVFSVVALSIQRFCAAVQSYRGKQLKRRVSMILIVCVWITACLFATPHTVFADVYNTKCCNSGIDHEFYITIITLFEFFMVCLLPVITIILLTSLTACTLSLTINNTAKDGRQAIQRVSKILVVVSIVFIISYIPFYLYRFLYIWYGLNLSLKTHTILQVVLYTLLFCNVCFNPVALYIVSHTFRYYFHNYLFPFCGELEESSNTDLTSYAEDVSQTTTPL